MFPRLDLRPTLGRSGSAASMPRKAAVGAPLWASPRNLLGPLQVEPPPSHFGSSPSTGFAIPPIYVFEMCAAPCLCSQEDGKSFTITISMWPHDEAFLSGLSLSGRRFLLMVAELSPRECPNRPLLSNKLRGEVAAAQPVLDFSTTSRPMMCFQ